LDKNRIKEEDDRLRVQYFVHVLRIFQTEFCAYLNKWDEMSLLIEVRLMLLYPVARPERDVQELVSSDPLALSTYEAIADILVRLQII
jgi:hypothetical protein